MHKNVMLTEIMSSKIFTEDRDLSYKPIIIVDMEMSEYQIVMHHIKRY